MTLKTKRIIGTDEVFPNEIKWPIRPSQLRSLPFYIQKIGYLLLSLYVLFSIRPFLKDIFNSETLVNRIPYIVYFLVSLIMVWIIKQVVWRFLRNHTESYRLKGNNLQITKGVFNRKEDPIPLRRFMNVQVEYKLWQRFVNIGDLHVFLARVDKAHRGKRMIFKGLPNPKSLEEFLNQYSSANKFSEVDFGQDGTSGGEGFDGEDFDGEDFDGEDFDGEDFDL